MTAAVKLRAVRPDDLRTLARMAVAFSDEDGHPLSAGGARSRRFAKARRMAARS
jgi:hypothetical protein